MVYIIAFIALITITTIIMVVVGMNSLGLTIPDSTSGGGGVGGWGCYI